MVSSSWQASKFILYFYRKQKEAAGNQISIDLPLHFGHHVFKKENDFQLPYDVWWQHFNDMVNSTSVISQQQLVLGTNKTGGCKEVAVIETDDLFRRSIW